MNFLEINKDISFLRRKCGFGSDGSDDKWLSRVERTHKNEQDRTPPATPRSGSVSSSGSDSEQLGSPTKLRKGQSGKRCIPNPGKVNLNGYFINFYTPIIPEGTKKRGNVTFNKQLAFVVSNPGDTKGVRLFFQDGERSNEFLTEKPRKTKNKGGYSLLKELGSLCKDDKKSTRYYEIENIIIKENILVPLQNNYFNDYYTEEDLYYVNELFKIYARTSVTLPMPLVLDKKGIDKLSDNPVSYVINMNDIFKKTKLYNDPLGQLKFYILYTMTYILDILHDFVDKKIDNILGNVIKFYKEQIRDTIKQIAPEIVKDKLLNTIINLFAYTNEERTTENQQKVIASRIIGKDGKPLRIKLSNGFNITQIFEDNALNLLRTQDDLQEVMESILDIFGIELTEIADSLEEAIKKNSELTFFSKILIGQDVVITSKVSYLRRLLKKYYESGKQDIYFFKSIADKYDSSGKKSEILNHLPDFVVNGPLHITEQFTINGVTKTIIEYKINDDSASITNFMNEKFSLKFDKSDIKSVSEKAKSSNNFKFLLFKTIGDKAKKDILYAIKQTPDPDHYPPLIIFISNDILSAMIGTIFLPGSIVTGKSVLRNKNAISILSEQEYLGVFKNQDRQSSFGKTFIKQIEKDIRYLSKKR